ncbi:hypothetical protein M569_13101, partial [Genlisea aurea]
MATSNQLWNLAKNSITAALVGLTISDRYGSFMSVRGSSMSPTLNPDTRTTTSGGFRLDDLVLVEKLCLHSHRYKFSRGDIVVFRSPTNHKEKNVKRIVGLPGDLIHLSSFESKRVPDGHCWVVGDNSSCSMDSRSQGPIPLGLICGRVTHIVWPPQRFASLN